MTWIEENEMDIFSAVVYSDHNRLLEYHNSPGNGLPSDVVFFALVTKNIEMIEFLLLDLKYDWYDYYAIYLKNFTEEEKIKIRDFLQLKRADQWLYEYRYAVLTDNVSELEYLSMFNYDLTDGGHILDSAISSGHYDSARFLLKRFVGTNRGVINTVIEMLQEI
jgi:hypothetical protein